MVKNSYTYLDIMPLNVTKDAAPTNSSINFVFVAKDVLSVLKGVWRAIVLFKRKHVSGLTDYTFRLNVVKGKV